MQPLIEMSMVGLEMGVSVETEQQANKAEAIKPENGHGSPPTVGPKKPKHISPSTAVRRLEGYVGGALAAKELLVDKLRDGKLRAYAGSTWISDQTDTARLWGKRPRTFWKDEEIDRFDFVKSPTWRVDLTQWRWQGAGFFCRHASGDTFTVYRGVKFDRDDFEKIEDTFRAALKKVTNAKSGRPPKTDARDDVWMAILRLSHENKLLFKSVSGAARDVQKITGHPDLLVAVRV